MADKIRSGLWVCRSGYFHDGVPVKAGSVVPRDFPYHVTDGHEADFAEVEVAEAPAGPFKVQGGARREAPVVEQATAAPGEKRTVRPARKAT